MPVRLPFRPRRDAYKPDLWTKCPGCGEMLFNKQLEKTLRVCPHCGHHFRISARARIDQLLDQGSFIERDSDLEPVDSLGFVDSKPYPDRLVAAQLQTGLHDAAVWGLGLIEGQPVSICVLDFFFMGGSMGSVVGEKVARAGEAALDNRIPLIIVSSSGGARMQEGTFSLMQLVKTMSVVERVKAARIPFISVMTDPTTGGTFASFAAVGDVNIAEPNALIRFAGDRVSAGTIGEELPPGYARAEFWVKHGFVDRIVPRGQLRDEIAILLSFLPAQIETIPETAGASGFRPRSFFSALTGALSGEGSGGLAAGPSNGSGPNGTNGEVRNGAEAKVEEPRG
jgi:acetyl-CoA carboxylase carboxyl transferase subunit beta